MDNVRRYDHDASGGEVARSFMVLHPQGDYVSYEDHENIVGELKKQLDEASERYVQLWTRSNYK